MTKAVIETQHALFAGRGDGLAVIFVQPHASVQMDLAALGLPTTLHNFTRVTLRVQNAGAPLTLEADVLGARCRLGARAAVAAGEAVLTVDLADLPLAAGIRPAREAAAISLRAAWEDARETTREVHILSLEIDGPDGGPTTPVVDRFGQRRSTDWPGKVHSDADLGIRLQREKEALAATPPRADRDAYGGLLAGPRFPAGGFFRVDRDPAGRHRLVTPHGHAFWSIGVTGVRTTDTTPTAGREDLFEELPPADGPLAAAYLPGPWEWAEDRRNVSFYRLNVLKKYGGIEAWADHALARLSAWGINTVGAFTHEPVVLGQRRIPHTRTIRTRPGPEDLPRSPAGFVDVFDPRWEAFVDRQVAAAVDPENPWLLGYFVDNEMPWRSMRLREAPAGSALAGVAARTPDDRELEGAYAERYFSTVARVLKRYDPNHLYMGCRFVRVPPENEAILHAAGRHCDVVSVNCYALFPDPGQFGRWHAATGRPVLIGEHHIPLASPRQLPPLYPAFTAGERRRYYARFLREWAGQPWSLGAHWFQHADQPLTGRASDGENQLIGLVDITDTPHEELVAAIGEAAGNVLAWRETREPRDEARCAGLAGS